MPLTGVRKSSRRVIGKKPLPKKKKKQLVIPIKPPAKAKEIDEQEEPDQHEPPVEDATVEEPQKEVQSEPITTIIQVLDGNELTTAGTAVNYVTEDGKMILSGIPGNPVFISGPEDAEDIVIATTDDGSVLEPTMLNTNTAGLTREQLQDLDPPQEALDPQNSYIIQGQDDYKVQLLQSIMDTESADLSVFCSDGVGWTSKLIMAAASPTIKAALESLGESLALEGTCLILPDVTRLEFSTFIKALSSPDEKSLDLVMVVKVAEALGVDLPITTDHPIKNPSEASDIDYKRIKGNLYDWRRVLRSVGYEPDLQAIRQDFDTQDATQSGNTASLSKIGKILEPDVECTECNRSFVDESALAKHTSTVHNDANRSTRYEETYPCDECDKTFKYFVNVKKHKWLCHRKNRKSVLRITNEPDASATTFVDESGVVIGDANRETREAKKAKDKEEKMADMKCQMCGYQAKSWRHLEFHLMSHSTDRPFKCKLCGKGFKDQQKLQRHNITHTKEKNYKCRYCSKAFGLRHNMKTHERVHEGGGYECKYCGRVFSQPGTLEDHEVKHAKRKHVKTSNPKLRKEQIVTDKRGRRSLADTLFGVGQKGTTKQENEGGKENVDLDIEEQMEAMFEDSSKT